MPIYLDTRGNTVLSVAICDRCSRKFPYVDLQPDPNFPGMRVCKDDLDKFDPWRLPARQTENIALRFPRPDVSVATPPDLINTEGDPNTTEQYDNFFIEGTPYGIAGAPGVINWKSSKVVLPASLSPIITSISPTTGPQAGGTAVTITGTNFNGVTDVKFGGVTATFTIVSPTQISATSPAYPITGIMDVSAASTFGVSVLQGSFTYT